MENQYSIRLITESDAEDVLNIYCYFMLETIISFEYEAPSQEDFLQRIKMISAQYSWLFFHRSFVFSELGVYKEIGYEFGEWPMYNGFSLNCSNIFIIRHHQNRYNQLSTIRSSIMYLLWQMNFLKKSKKKLNEF